MQDMNAMERLDNLVHINGPLVAGLDPDFRKITELYEASYRGGYENVVWDFCVEYIRALIRAEVYVIKINTAFFEAYNAERLYWQVAAYAKSRGLYVIGDVKRADIGNTSEQYARAFLKENSPFDAITINPYFGTDGVKPFLDLAKKNRKGVFILVKTSNPSSKEIQDQVLADGRKVYELVANLTKQWGEYTGIEEGDRYSLVGAVVGATHPKEAEELRKLMPNTFFLVPGYGAQGATAEDIVVNFDEEGGGAIVNSSRGLMFACNNNRWKRLCTKRMWYKVTEVEAHRVQQELKEALKKHM